VRRRLLNALLYFPGPSLPAAAGEDVWCTTADGERIHGLWLAAAPPTIGHVLLCHGNAGDVTDRLPYAVLLAAAGLDVLLFDYRGYGRSTGRPSEQGTHADARAAREALLARDGVDPRRLIHLGESLGGAVALRLAVEHPPAGLVLQSTFTSVRAMARHHYPFIPAPVVPDAYPSLRLVRDLRAPLLVLHGEDDDLVPVGEGRALHDAAPEPKQLHVFAGRGHNDLLGRDGSAWIARWRGGLRTSSGLPHRRVGDGGLHA
jgi:fermentation-respiration switch protein FrsA (DUF1100 family)